MIFQILGQSIRKYKLFMILSGIVFSKKINKYIHYIILIFLIDKIIPFFSFLKKYLSILKNET